MVKEKGQRVNDLKILDIASGPEMLKKHSGEEYQPQIISFDINREHFRDPGQNRAVGSFMKMPIRDETIDYANFSLALHYTQFIPSKGNYERLEAILELNRVLKTNGRAVINIIYSLNFKELENFKKILYSAGFKLVDEYSGNITAGQNYKSFTFTLEKMRHISGPSETIIQDIKDKNGTENLEGLKFVENRERLRESRKIIESFNLGQKNFEVKFNRIDFAILQEEQEIIKQGEKLKEQYGNTQNIPKEELAKNQFNRILIKNRYFLFKKIKNSEGIVVIK